MAAPDFREMTATLYRAVSAEPGKRDWDVVRRCYHPEARLVRTGIDPDGTPFVRVMTLDAYIDNVEDLLRDVRFLGDRNRPRSGCVRKRRPPDEPLRVHLAVAD